MSTGRRQLSTETLVLSGIGLAFLAVGAVVCFSAYRAGQASVDAPVVSAAAPALPPASDYVAAPAPAPVFAPEPPSVFDKPGDVEAYAPPAVNAQPVTKPRPLRPTPPVFETPDAPSVALGAPQPPRRPIQLNAPPPPPPPPPGAKPTEVAALTPPDAPAPESSAPAVSFGPKPAALNNYDRFTAVYDLSAHTVFLPDGTRLEAHSGLGAIKDDPSHVDQKDRGATPPHVYDLTMREELFHGVQALRLNPVGGSDSIFGRAGLLTHTYMLGPGGDSNGCVSFKNYETFLQAFQSGQVKRMAVVAALR